MEQSSIVKPLGLLIVLMIGIVAGSWLSMRIWGGKEETLPLDRELVIQENMTIREFGTVNQVSEAVLKKVVAVTSDADWQKTVQSLNIAPDDFRAKVKQALAFEAEESSKNWVKIAAKFLGWGGFLIVVFLQLKRGKVTPRLRKIFLLTAIVLFGVILGSDPSPMGTVKDTIVLLGKSHIIFPPRVIALTVMLVFGVILANKFLCAWGCQLGTLQDFIFRLNRDANDRRGILPQFKIPFRISNAIRIAVLVAIAIVAFGWAIDFVGLIDPFKLYNPAALGISGIIFLAVLLIASLFVYRPWCHLCCPFGLVGWLAEKVSRAKITVDYTTCIACETCANVCPSTVMNAILKQDQTIPDCFACGNCMEVCPTKSIRFQTGKRQTPPAGKFAPKKTA